MKMRTRSGVICTLKLRVTNAKNGCVISEREEKAHSFVRNFIQMLFYGSTNVGNNAYKDKTGTMRQAAYIQSNGDAGLACVGGAGNSSIGILIGTSNTAFDISQYNMQALIGHGTGTGQMTYVAMPSPGAPVFANPDISLVISRDFTNNSGAAITVREIGLMGYPTYYYASFTMYAAYVLYARDVVADTVVAPGQVLNVQYIFKTVV
jgi:hypothetical protein